MTEEGSMTRKNKDSHTPLMTSRARHNLPSTRSQRLHSQVYYLLEHCTFALGHRHHLRFVLEGKLTQTQACIPEGTLKTPITWAPRFLFNTPHIIQNTHQRV
ncbi:uncharacterized protein PGTG_18145 [Puccinia graminis f. sp. tritici CRL 75-36-700-3]|uniref:Uncharacterized protein n=1 Tax=Puccinia graminis f. sp. tritici (strain CRL 75-36-700-3 / race SCCL) TaxID=418459 RepID=E3L680_PUCGT|nr:uncharacterized protein PGTG_18145 [Puccinia graminis f. sp. tritici CRL 75-36-700-3]EFP92055.1 hypothetical protein PGTG_18145 [Puccinia graminis f. sp. tritici CRL 75-36-700-3]